MPLKRRRGKKIVKRRKGKRGGGKIAKRDVMVNKMPKRLHTAIAPHYFTTLEYGFTGNQTLGAGVQGYFNVWANGLFHPGDNLQQVGTAVANYNQFSSVAYGGTLYPATLALNALNPAGETQLSVLYSRYRVHMSRIQVTCQPLGAGVDTMCAVTPINGDSLAIPLPGNDIQRAQSEAYTKFITCSAGNNIKQNTISLKCRPFEITGQTKQQYRDDPNTSGQTSTSNPGAPASAASGNYSGVFWQVNTSPFSVAGVQSNNFEIRVTYYVEFYEPVAMLDT